MAGLTSLDRNTTEVFARRVRKNLDFIISKHQEGEDVHEVTQLVISLLGLIVFPWEHGALQQLEKLRLSDLEANGWPQWEIVLDKKQDPTTTLGKLIYHLRNAAAHRRLRFSSDDPLMEQVQIEFHDAPNPEAAPNWRARINAANLKDFCERFTDSLETYVG